MNEIKQTNEIGWWQWGTVCLVGVAAIAGSELIRFSPKWEDGTVLTTTAFTTVIVLSKRLWSHLSFWAVLVGLLVITLLGLAGAPFSFFGVPVAIAASVSQWGMLVFARGRFGIPKQCLVAFLALHYASAALLLVLPSSAFSDWEHMRRLPESYRFLLVVGFGWYCLGQMFVWKAVASEPISA